MDRAEFWCRILGWLQMAGGFVVALTIILVWKLLFAWMEQDNGALFAILISMLVFVFAAPAFLSGLFTVIFARRVEQARNGANGGSNVVLRVLMVFAGLWAAGVIGIGAVTLPHLGFFAVMGLITAFLGLMGAEWLAGQG
ncbi:hypothetical protein [Aestuariivirga sp.]|uniref:hypothetical protein n=1 Tax=Aestuariivirga sp. TaxID=2650926 RepID=UPI0039E51162